MAFQSRRFLSGTLKPRVFGTQFKPGGISQTLRYQCDNLSELRRKCSSRSTKEFIENNGGSSTDGGGDRVPSPPRTRSFGNPAVETGVIYTPVYLESDSIANCQDSGSLEQKILERFFMPVTFPVIDPTDSGTAVFERLNTESSQISSLHKPCDQCVFRFTGFCFAEKRHLGKSTIISDQDRTTRPILCHIILSNRIEDVIGSQSSRDELLSQTTNS